MPEQQPENIIDQFWKFVEQLLLPNWSNLILLLPWVLVGLVLVWLLFTAFQWRRAAPINRSRVPPPRRGGSPPPGVHLPGPSRWPFVVPIGAALILFSFAVPPHDASGAATSLVNVPVFALGMLVVIVAVIGWLWDAMREWRTVDSGGHAALAVAAGDMAALHGGGGAQMLPATTTAAAPEPVAPKEAPAGVHMPGPSPWPFFAPIAVALILFGLVFSAAMIAGGLVLAVIAAGGWLWDSMKEYDTVEELGHPQAGERDPAKVWPKALVPIFAVVIALSLLVTLAPIGLTYLNSLTPPSAGPTAVAVPAVPEISASSAVHFDTTTLVVPAGRAFDLVFHNKQDGVPHNFRIDDSPAATTILFDGDEIVGVADITYHVPALPEGSYYFLCRVHPNMNGTLASVPEKGGPGGPGGPGASGAPGGPPPPGASPVP